MRLLIIVMLAVSLLTSAAAAQPDNVFRQAHDVGKGARSSLDPISQGRVLQITEKIMNRLARPGMDGLPQPDLATEWYTNKDGTVWTVKLREGVLFHDGSPFVAADVVYTFNRTLDPATNSPAQSLLRMFSGIEALDDLTVQFTLESTFADLPLLLMDPRLRIIPAGTGDEIAQTGIGTGPFMVEKFDPDGITHLVANPNYWEGAPYIERIEIIGVPDSQARLQAFLAGQLDMERGILPLLRRALTQSDRYIIQDIPTGNWSGFVFRTDTAPFTDPRVRKAIRLAVDREELLKLALDGGGTVSCDTPVAPDDQYRANMECPQDIEAARELLIEAGYPNGIGIDLHVSTIDQAWSALAVAFQQQVLPAGIYVNIVKSSADGYWTEIWKNKDSFATSWSARPADQVLNEAYHSSASGNESYYRDPNFELMLLAARKELNFEDRRKLYIRAQEHLADTSGTLIPFHRTQLVGLSKRVRDIDPVRSDVIRWHLVKLVDPDT
ncbi:Heme-binding protein A precursor [Roseovarius albus]|uniref:Heme-binding protein A n=1 Tax=Roseovarius albus TaxID=1247867 RepID=A0A1X7A1S6_9RHOB|nr:ABC transporter substrate-binding protein [Roseovarius albus]SLN67821.1 Heme-binding protein A precursor [Roseovarius albus]